MIRLLIIVALLFPRKIVIMTPTKATVPQFVKAAGGTNIAITQTSMVCTSMGSTIAVE